MWQIDSASITIRIRVVRVIEFYYIDSNIEMLSIGKP